MGYLERLESYRDEMLATLGESVAIPSVKGDAVKTEDGRVLPFGLPVHEALEHMLEKGRSMGFETYNDDNYAGHIEWKAADGGDGYFGIIGHLDVMPEGDGWTVPPFEMTDKGDGFVYGRGTSDDKGPLISCLYALKALKDEGLEPAMNIRLVLGLDEESGDISANHYTENCGHPVMGFTPDGDFPLVNGEMGILVFDLAQKFSHKPAKDELRLTKMSGGTAHNAVPAVVRAVISGESRQYDLITDRAKLYSEETGYDVKTKKQGSSLVVEATGVAAHGAHPDLGLNAISIMMGFLGNISFANEELNDYIAFYNDYIGFNLHGENIGCGFEDGPSGPLIFNVGIVNINEEIASLSINIRYPVSFTDRQVLDGIEKTAEGRSIGIVTRMVQPPIFKGLDDPMVVKLMDAYIAESGDTESRAATAAGGSYAKMFNNILCYGGMFPGEENTMHQADEKFSKDSYMKMARVYARAIHALCFE